MSAGGEAPLRAVIFPRWSNLMVIGKTRSFPMIRTLPCVAMLTTRVSVVSSMWPSWLRSVDTLNDVALFMVTLD